MDDTLQDLENELKALRPRRPSTLLRARIEHDLASPSAPAQSDSAPAAPAVARRYTSATTLRSWKWLGWQMAAAAAIALTVSLGVWQWQSGKQLPATGAEVAVAPGNDSSAASVPAPDREPPATQRMLAAADRADVYRPVKAANVLYELKDEGPVMLEDNTPARRLRARYLDTYTWKNPATNASLKWSVPRDEVRVMPTNFH